MGKSIKGMTLEQAKAYKQELKAAGKTESTSKEFGKLADYIKTLEPAKYGKADVASAYSKLSRGVTTTGGWTEKNLDKIEETTGTRPRLTAPKTTEELSSYLNDYQDSLYNASGGVELRDSIASQLEPNMAKPEPLNRIKEYEKLRAEQGVADLETSLTDLKAQLEEQYATKRTRTRGAEGKPVAMGVIAGRVSEIERQENERIDAIGRQINVISDQLNTSYNVISQYMNFMGLDYQDAVSAYNAEFTKNLQIYQLVDAEMDEQVAAARANLQLYANAITSGNMSYDSLSSDQKVMLNKLEVQSGLPIGFTSNLGMSAKDKLLNVNSSTGEALILNNDGSFKVVKTGMTPTGGTGSSSSKFQSALEQGRADLEKGYSWGDVYDRIHKAYPEASAEDIDAGLGKSWREGGAYEAYKEKTGKAADVSADTEAEIASVKQLIISNGGSESDLTRAETDANFRAWILANKNKK